MLAKAVQDHHPGLPGMKDTTVQKYNKSNSNPLKPMPPSALNTLIPAWSKPANPSKRTASQAEDYNTPTKDQDFRSKKVMTDTAHSGRIGKLQNAVFFDENDFDDDADVDLDAEDVLPDLSMAKSTEWTSPSTLLPDPTIKSATSQIATSGTPLPWSSSPLSHHQKPLPIPKAASLPASSVNNIKRRTLPWVEEAKRIELERVAKVTANCEDLSGGSSTQDMAEIEAGKDRMEAKKQSRLSEELAEGKRPTKRKRPSDDHSADDSKGLGLSEHIIEKVRKERYTKGDPTRADVYTPLPKDKPKSPYPWNKTASAFKEEQKKFRQGNKKLVKDPVGLGLATSKTKKREAVARVFLSDEQRSVLDLVAEKSKSVFFTGSAGTGKSVLLRETIKVLRDRYRREPDRVAVTASTGLAACNVGGVTLHSFAGIGLGKDPVPELVKKIKRNQKAKTRWMRTKVLIVDEISMVDGDLFDKLESIARAIRNNGRPFGGIQLVITGDFFQLPPVPDYGRISKFAFDAATWNTSIEHTIGLNQVFRQKDPGMLL